MLSLCVFVLYYFRWRLFASGEVGGAVVFGHRVFHQLDHVGDVDVPGELGHPV